MNKQNHKQKRRRRSKPRFRTASLPSGNTCKPLAISVQEFEHLSSLGHTTTYGLINSGVLETIKVHNRRLILYPSAERLLLGASSKALEGKK